MNHWATAFVLDVLVSMFNLWLFFEFKRNPRWLRNMNLAAAIWCAALACYAFYKATGR